MPYTISGTITTQSGRGTKLGVPTINCSAPAGVPDGVYAGYVEHRHITYPAAIFIGAAITFDEVERQVEAHLIDQTISLVGDVTVQVFNFIRPNQKFDTIEALRQQIDQDIKAVKRCLPELFKTK